MKQQLLLREETVQQLREELQFARQKEEAALKKEEVIQLEHEKLQKSLVTLASRQPHPQSIAEMWSYSQHTIKTEEKTVSPVVVMVEEEKKKGVEEEVKGWEFTHKLVDNWKEHCQLLEGKLSKYHLQKQEAERHCQSESLLLQYVSI